MYIQIYTRNKVYSDINKLTMSICGEETVEPTTTDPQYNLYYQG